MAITNAIMQMRRGLEADFDPDKMLPGEWAVSLDTKYVRMCFSPGVCVRMATYEAFEADMVKIQKILEECQTIEEAVKQIQLEIDAKEIAIEKYVQEAKAYSETASDEADRATLEADRAKTEADRASSIANIGIATTEKAGIVKPDGETIRVDADGTIHADNGTVDYNELENKPKINDVELSGSKSLSDLGIASADDLEETNSKVNIIIEKAELNIKNNASGENIHLTDSANSKVVEFGLYGKATQDGEPTPDNPIEITVSGSDGSVEVVTVNEDSTESTVSTIPTSEGLAGIPVESGGNYTDENGQQWICDEVVKYADGSGKRVQRIGKYTLPNDSSYTLNTNDTYGNYFSKVVASFIPNPSSGTKMLETVCTHFAKGNPYKESGEILSIWAYDYSDIRFRINGITTTSELATWLESNTVEILYELVTPIITDLTAEEIAEIEKLHTFYPVTNISNNADCGMSITYLCDVKNYIDNRLAQIESAMINNI